MGARLKLKGETFGKLKVIDFAYVRNSNSYWVCQCQCGKIREVIGNNLTHGTTTTCGCSRKRPRKRKRTPIWKKTYSAWKDMVDRCTNEKSKVYKYYGKRGISVCNRWRDFDNFLADVGLASEGLTLDRIDNDGDYEPGNCKWVTQKEQMNNTRWNVRGAYKGKKLTLMQFVERFVSREDYDKIRYLVRYKKMNFEEALQSFKERRAP